MKNRSQAEIFEFIKSMLPVRLYTRYSHLSYGEMADMPELAEYADELRQAETDWFEAE